MAHELCSTLEEEKRPFPFRLLPIAMRTQINQNTHYQQRSAAIV
jgi:hypothetical protein